MQRGGGHFGVNLSTVAETLTQTKRIITETTVFLTRPRGTTTYSKYEKRQIANVGGLQTPLPSCWLVWEERELNENSFFPVLAPNLLMGWTQPLSTSLSPSLTLPTAQLRAMWREKLSVWSPHSRHQKQLPERAWLSEISLPPYKKTGRDVPSQVSLAYLSPSSTRSIGDGIRIGSWSLLSVFVLLGIFPPQTKSRIWDETPFYSISGSISALLPLLLWCALCFF